MLNQNEISADEHHNWFVRVKEDSNRQLLIAEDESGLLGFAQFTGVARGGIAGWGFYARPDAPKGSGTKLCSLALDHAFESLELHKVYGQAIEKNAPSVAIHRKLGFTEEGVLRDHRHVNGAYVSLVCFGVLNHEWATKRNRREV